MNIVYILIAILILGFIIMVHELGHYAVGRLCHLGIEEFSIGFGPKLIQWGKGIRYTLRALPIGGYVRFVGEDADSEDPRAFNNAPVWKRFATTLAGAAMNFVLAYLVTLGILLCMGVDYYMPLVGSVIEGTPAQEYGLQAGDRITSVDGTEVPYSYEGYQEMSRLLSAHDKSTELTLGVDRAGEAMEVTLPMRLNEEGNYQVGFYIGYERLRMPFAEAVPYAGEYLWNIGKLILVSLKNLVFKGEGAKDMMGTVGIVGEMSKGIQAGFEMVLNYIILISFNLGIMNLLPLPALDGGRLVFLAFEGIFRKPVPRGKEAIVHLIGMALLLLLMVVLTYQDIMRLITGG